MADDATALEAQLREKDDIIAALTERLEQAAEQLDRIHRSGGDRGLHGNGGGGGLPPELVEQQKDLTDQLQQAVEQWEEMQAALTLERLEDRVLELKDLVNGSAPVGPRTGAVSSSSDAAETPAGKREAAQPQPSASTSSSSSWETLKAQLFASEGGEAPSEETPTQEPADSAPVEADRIDEAGADELSAVPDGGRDPAEADLDEGPEPDPPEPVDFEAAGPDDLRQAVEQRDAYIMYLTRRIRMVQLRCTPPGGWASLENAPEELRTRLEELEGQLEQNLRLAEVEFSLERARLAREAAKLQQAQDRIEQEKKRLGLDEEGTDDSSEHDAGPPAEQPRESGRWMKFLGKGRRGNDKNG